MTNILNKLQNLSQTETETIREAFIKHSHSRFTKYFFSHMPFGRKEAYTKGIKKPVSKGLHA